MPVSVTNWPCFYYNIDKLRGVIVYVCVVTYCPRLYLRALLPPLAVARRPVTNNVAV